MRTTILLAVLFAGLGVGAVATTSDASAGGRRWAIVYLAEPTLIGSTIVQGPVLFVHDDEALARGEPCTSVRLFVPEKGPVDEIASFHCIRVERPAAGRFTLRTRPNTEAGFGCVLTEYQFAGDREGHGVPLPGDAH